MEKQEENIFCVFQLDQTAKLGSLIVETMALEKSVEATERLDLLGKSRAGNREKPTALLPNFCLQLVSSKGNSNAISEIFLPDNARDLLARCDTFLPPVGLHHHDCPDANRNFQISQLSTSTAQLGIKVLQTFGKFKMEEPRKISFQ